MTVQEFIDKLSQLPPDSHIWLSRMVYIGYDKYVEDEPLIVVDGNMDIHLVEPFNGLNLIEGHYGEAVTFDTLLDEALEASDSARSE